MVSITPETDRAGQGGKERPGFLRRHAYSLTIVCAMSLGGIVYARLCFEEVSLAKAIFGGLSFGFFSATCCLGFRLYEE